MPISTLERVDALVRDLGSQARLAAALGVDPGRVSRWLRGAGIDPGNVERIELLELVVARLSHVYQPEAVEDWLFGLNPQLHDRRPIDLVRSGRHRELLDAIRAEAAGSYA